MNGDLGLAGITRSGIAATGRYPPTGRGAKIVETYFVQQIKQKADQHL